MPELSKCLTAWYDPYRGFLCLGHRLWSKYVFEDSISTETSRLCVVFFGQVDGMKVTLDADADGTVTKAEFHALLHGDEL